MADIDPTPPAQTPRDRTENVEPTTIAGSPAPGVVAVYEDDESARAALVGLERAGFDAAATALVGPAPGNADPDGASTAALALDASGHLAGNAARGMAVGAAAGALSALAVPGLAPVAAAGALAAATGGGAAGAGVGAMLNIEKDLPVQRGWEDTFARVAEGRTIVIVHTTDDDGRDAAEAALEGTGALDVFRAG